MNSPATLATPLRHPSIRRVSHVFVEIPPSPILRSQKKSLQSPCPHVPINSTHLKENTRPRPPKPLNHVEDITMASTPLKRKLSTVEVVVSSSKKTKVLPTVPPQAPEKSKVAKMAAAKSRKGDQANEFPNGHFYCHQCNAKKDPCVGIHCTVEIVNPKSGSVKRCPVKLCKRCLKNRYGEDVEAIMAKGRTPSKKDRRHVESETYTFKCPKCRDICHCFKCRKAKGLVPNGTSTTAQASKTDADIAKAGTSKPKPDTVKASTSKPKPDTAKASTSKPKLDTAKVSTSSKPNPSGKPRPKANRLPNPKWAAVSTNLSFSQAQDRFHIREFVLRFSSLMETISYTHLEELASIAETGRLDIGAEEDSAMEEWVGEGCLRAVIIGLLGLIARDEEGRIKEVIKAATTDIRANSANLNIGWSFLASMRENLARSSTLPKNPGLLTFPDPLPPPTGDFPVTKRTTRSRKIKNIPEIVVVSAQMVPVLAALVEVAMQTEIVREDLEAAIKAGKERIKEARDDCKRENERWDEERKAMEGTETKAPHSEIKAKREAHKQIIQDLESALKLVMHTYTPRFEPLGRDVDGRTYWALTPGSTERDGALELLLSGKENAIGSWRTKKSRKKVGSREERRAMRNWSWFVAVWGQRPPLAETANLIRDTTSDDSDDDDEFDEDGECWWGFWEPSEVRNLAGWIGRRVGLHEGNAETADRMSPLSDLSDDEDLDEYSAVKLGPPTKDEVKETVKSLEEYADLLEWRIRKSGDREDEV